MKVVVTGGAGFIGSHITDALVQRGYDVHVVDTLVEGKHEHVPSGATLHVQDVCDGSEIAPIFEDASYVVHLAALPRVQFSFDHPERAHHTNVNGTLQALIASKKASVRRFVFASSSSVYGDQEILPLGEHLPTKPKSPYGLHKYLGELYCRLYSELFGLPTVSLRYFNVYGSRQSPDGSYALVIPKFLQMRKEGRPLTVSGDGLQTRDFTHVDDVVRASLLALESPRVGDGESINIGSGRNISINQIAELIGGPVEYVSSRPEPRHTLADIRKAKLLIGWEPQVSIEDGIEGLKREWSV